MVDSDVLAEAMRRWSIAERQRLAELEGTPAGSQAPEAADNVGTGAGVDAEGGRGDGGIGAAALDGDLQHASGRVHQRTGSDAPTPPEGQGGSLVGAEVRAGAVAEEPVELRDVEAIVSPDIAAGDPSPGTHLSRSGPGGLPSIVTAGSGVVSNFAPIDVEYVPSSGVPAGDGEFDFRGRGDSTGEGPSNGVGNSPPPAPSLATGAPDGGMTTFSKPSRKRPTKAGAKKP